MTEHTPPAGDPAGLKVTRIRDRQQYFDLREGQAESYATARTWETQLWRSHLARGRPVRFEVPGFCHPCGAESTFEVTDDYSWMEGGVLVPNWREHLRCTGCGLNNRMRAIVHVLEEVLRADREQSIYITEHCTPLFSALAARFPDLHGSEFLRDGTPCGQVNAHGFRHEDLTALTFASGSMDLVLTFDVLEHVPDFRAGLAEILRILRPGGQLLLSVPFRIDATESRVRARLLEDGTIDHIDPPEYHGDPCSAEGCLAFYHYSWDLLEHFRAAGFTAPGALAYSSVRHCYFGADQILFTARKA